MRKPEDSGPLRLLLLTALSVCVGEILVMLLLAELPQLSVLTEAVVDGCLLTVLVTPILYSLIFRPMSRHIAERRSAEAALKTMNSSLEARVAERTARLSDAFDRLRREVAERKASDASLMRNSAFVQNVVESAPFLLLIYDAKSFRCSYVNGRVTELLGYVPEEVFARGKRFFDSILEPDDLTALRLLNSQLVDEGQDEVAARRFRLRRADGERRPFLVRMSTLARDLSGAGEQVLFSAIEEAP